MFVKTEFNEFEVVIEDATFTLREGDPLRYILTNMKTTGANKAEFDINEIQDSFLNESLVGWKGLFKNENKEPLDFKTDNFKFIPAQVKAALWNNFVKRCSFAIDEKKSL